MRQAESTGLGPAGGPTRAIVSIREANEAEVPRILEIDNAVFPDFPETLEEFQANQARLRAGGYTSVFAVAEVRSGQIVGYSNFHHMPGQFDPARYLVVVGTDPAWQRRGVGSALLAQMLRAVAARGGRAIESFAQESKPEVVAFLVRRGFRETMRVWEYRLDVRRFDPAPFARYLVRAREAEVEVTTLERERRRDPGALRRAYELHNAVVADIPAPIPFTPPPFEHYLLSNVESPRALLDAYFLAKVGEVYIGEANLQRPVQGTYLHHDVTGVLPAYRGRGIAMALKLATIAYAQARDSTEIRTWNEVQNTGMLVINERLGFVRQPAWITFERTLTPAGSA